MPRAGPVDVAPRAACGLFVTDLTSRCAALSGL
jgi:hypothetical protein